VPKYICSRCGKSVGVIYAEGDTFVCEVCCSPQRKEKIQAAIRKNEVMKRKDIRATAKPDAYEPKSY
jgi:DNA-directed RNA polymerase subunit RPC12/RpoP